MTTHQTHTAPSTAELEERIAAVPKRFEGRAADAFLKRLHVVPNAAGLDLLADASGLLFIRGHRVSGASTTTYLTLATAASLENLRRRLAGATSSSEVANA